MPQVVIEMSGKEAALWRAQQKIIQQQVAMETGYKKAGQAGHEAGTKAGQAFQEAGRKSEQAGSSMAKVGDVVKGQLMGIAGALGLTGGIAGAVALIQKGFENWSANLREITAEVQKAGDEIVAFAALQEGGTKRARVQAAAELGTRYGVTSRGEAFDIVQAMQSMLGTFDKGMAAAEEIFQASQAGIPIDLGAELETLGISQGAKPGETLRKAFAAGEASGRTPRAMAKVAEALAFFEDPDFMFAVGTMIAGSFPESQLPVYMKRLGEGLSPISGAAEWYEAHGVGKGATQQARLEKLAAEGIDTLVELEEIGIAETRERQGLVKAIPHVKRIREVQKEIPEIARPGLLEEERRTIEEELPWMKPQREMKILAAMYADEKAFGQKVSFAQQREREQAIRGMALKNLGRETVGPVKTYTVSEAGVPISSMFDQIQLAVVDVLSGQSIRRQDELRLEEDRIRRYLEAAAPGQPPSKLPLPGTPEWKAWFPEVEMPSYQEAPPYSEKRIAAEAEARRREKLRKQTEETYPYGPPGEF